MSRIDNMMVAISEVESAQELFDVIRSHLSRERGFKIEPCNGRVFGQEEDGIAAMDLDALEEGEVDVIVMFPNGGYKRFRIVEEMEETIRERRRGG